jgi:hypothetical protein
MITRGKTFSVEEVMDHIKNLLLGVKPPETKADIEFLESLNKLIEEQKQKQKDVQDDTRTT